MEVNYDYWQGESLPEVIQTIAEFRKQVLTNEQPVSQRPLSDEINYLQHYFDSESTIIVANDCGSIVGYISLINELVNHPKCEEYSYYGSDLVVSEGPLVHPDYRSQGIGKGLMMEALHSCQNRSLEVLIIEPSAILSNPIDQATYSIAAQFDFNVLNKNEPTIFKKQIEAIF